jgi:DNA-binding response OmpR family regulator
MIAGVRMDGSAGHVLVIEDDADIAEIVLDALTVERYSVTILHDRRVESIHDAIGRLRPDCVLLDGENPGGFGASWAEAAWMSAQGERVPVIMFSADAPASREAQANVSERSQAAGFSSVLSKPFDIDELMRVVEIAVSQSPFRSNSAE